MATLKDSLLVKFHSKDTRFGMTRSTLTVLAERLDLSETQVIHLALSNLAAEILPAYEPDDGPLNVRQIRGLHRDIAERMPKGITLSKEALFS